MSGNGNNVSAIPMAKQNASEQVENELSKNSLRSSKVTSEIDFLKRMKLKKYIASVAGTDAALKEIVEFQSADDERIQQIYAKLIKMYKESEAEKKAAATDTKGEVGRTARNAMSNIYSQFGYRDLFSIASVIAEIQRVRAENEDILSSVKGLFT